MGVHETETLPTQHKERDNNESNASMGVRQTLLDEFLQSSGNESSDDDM